MCFRSCSSFVVVVGFFFGLFCFLIIIEPMGFFGAVPQVATGKNQSSSQFAIHFFPLFGLI